MNRQFADQVANRVGAEIDIAQSRIAAHGQRRVACWRKAQAGLVSPVVDERFEMLPAAHALHVFLRGERGMRGKDLEAVELAVLEHEEPSCVAKGIEAANGARRAFRDWVIRRRPLDKQSSVDRGSGQEALTRALVEGDGQHPLGGVKTEREVRGGAAEPEMFTSAELPPVAVESAAGVRRQSFRQGIACPREANGSGSCTPGWRIYGAWLCPVFSSVEPWPERFHR